MSKQRVILVLFLTLITGVIWTVASAAAAEPAAEWLVSGVPVTSSTIQDSGEMLLEDTKTVAGKASMTCSAILLGTFKASGQGEITEVQNLAKEKVALGGTALLCKNGSACENSTDVEAWPVGLPWSVVAVEMKSIFWAVVSGEGFASSCLVLGLKVEDECTTGDAGVKLKNATEGVTVEAPEEAGGTCSLGGSETGVLSTVGTDLITPTAGGTLSVSE